MTVEFSAANLHATLAAMTPEALDALDFGVIGMKQDGTVVVYNRFESEAAGLSPDRVIGHNFFLSVAPCTNNFMIAQRFSDEQEIDDIINYVFTLRMRPTPVQLRLLKSADAPLMYLLVDWRRKHAH